ncbi:MAG: hypothetical protein KGL39_47555 [Patescibacteria group bacterium]|nr:hypothetical protein [Patescibacteria group bacterium]
MAHTSFLTPEEKRSLLDWIGAHGEGYPGYLDWCEREAIPNERRFTKASYGSWVQRRRLKVQASRANHREESRRQSRMDREARMLALEATFARLDQLTRNSGVDDPDKLVRLEEQKRKTLEAIAKERGEWLSKEQFNQTKPAVDDLMARMANRELKVVS